MEKELLDFFTKHYFSRKEVVYRLPVSENIRTAWPDILKERQSLSTTLPLKSWDGNPYWYVPVPQILVSGDHLAETARIQELNQWEDYLHDDGIIDEAYYSSVIEGAYSTRKRAHELVKSDITPKNLNEQMILNNYRALHFVLEHLDGPINEAVVLEIGRLLTEGTLDPDTSNGYRNGPVYVVSANQEIVYQAPDAEYVRPMMQQLLAYIADPDIHPVIKAAVAHIYFVTIHPFNDGNGRTARALSYMILLQAGYDFFRQVPISGLLSQERSKYYKAIRASQDTDNDYDFTYFLSYYIEMLSRTVDDMHERVDAMKQLRDLEEKLTPADSDGTPGSSTGTERLLNGARWMVTENVQTITTEKWKTKFKTSFETARQDLNLLTKLGFLQMRTVGRKHFYDRMKKDM